MNRHAEQTKLTELKIKKQEVGKRVPLDTTRCSKCTLSVGRSSFSAALGRVMFPTEALSHKAASLIGSISQKREGATDTMS